MKFYLEFLYDSFGFKHLVPLVPLNTFSTFWVFLQNLKINKKCMSASEANVSNKDSPLHLLFKERVNTFF